MKIKYEIDSRGNVHALTLPEFVNVEVSCSFLKLLDSIHEYLSDDFPF